MTWFRVDDDLPEHVKADELADVCGDDAVLLAASWMVWLHLGCDCARRRTDGFFTLARAHRVVRLPATTVDKALDALSRAGLMDAAPGGYLFHDWPDYQPTRAELDAKRKASSARQNRWRRGAKTTEDVDAPVDASTDASTPPSTDASTHASQGASTPPSTDASTHASVDAPPSRPVPSRPNPNKTDGSPSGGAPSGVESGKGRRKEPASDTIPAPGTPARAIYDALVNDAVLRPITGNPGDFAARISDPATYPGVNVLAEVKRAGEWASTKPGKYSDGRAFLRNWLQRKADDAAKAPKPAAAPGRAAAPPPVAVPPKRTPPPDPDTVAAIRAANERLKAERPTPEAPADV